MRLIRVEMVCQGCYQRLTTKEADPNGVLRTIHTDDSLRKAGWLITKNVCYCPACQDHVVGGSATDTQEDAK